MKRNKKIVMLLGLLLCVSLAAFGVNRYEERKEMIKNSDEIILEVADEDVTALSWECDTGDFAFHKDESGSWLYDTDEAFPVDDEKIRELLGQFREFGVSFIIEEVEDWGQYGLDKPVCTVHMETESETYEILLGNYSAMDSERYVSIGDGNAYLVKNDPLEQFEIEISDMIRHDEIPQIGDVTQVQFSGVEEEQIVYEEDSAFTYYAEDVYFMKQGDDFMPLDIARVNDYLDTVKYLNLEDYVAYNASEEDLKTYGMDAPELTIMLDYTTDEEETDERTSGTFILNIGRDPEEREEEAMAEREEEAMAETEEEAMAESEEESASEEEEKEITAYARVGESKIIYQITVDEYKKLMDMSYDALRHQEMFWADFEDMYQLDILLEDKAYTITSVMEDEERAYYYNDEEIEMAEIRGAIRGLTAVDFTDEEPTQKEEISLVIHLDNENYPEVPIQLYRYDGNNCIAVVDGNTVALVERAKVIDLVEAVNAIVLDSAVIAAI